MSSPVFVADRLLKRFPGVVALDHASLRVQPGTVHALLGENGAGKSTLIKIMTGVYQPDAGQMLMRGAEVRFANPHDASSRGIGVVHQERNLIPGFSVGENITLQAPPTRFGFVDRAQIRSVAERWLAELELDLDPNTPVSQLSVAQMQLVEIAKALSMRSDFLLLDEPTASSTPSESEKLFTVVRKLRDQGTAVLFVSHKLEEVFEICDEVTVLRDGRAVLESGRLSDYGKDGIVDLMVGRSYQQVTLGQRPPIVALDRAPALELDRVSTASGHRDVSLSVRAGEIIGLYGLVGAGRSELAKAVLGLDRIVGGELLVHGEPVRIHGVGEALHRHRIGYVTENRKEEGVFLTQSVTRNIAVTVWDRLARRLGRVSERDEKALAAELVDRLGIKVASGEQHTGQLSGGNQQKVSLAKWLAARTEILIIDEPTVGIDIRTKGAFHELIWQLASEGLAILLITSDLPEMVTLADRIIVMNDFQLVGEVVNGRGYEAVSTQVIRLIHADEENAA
ncbi:sugar ABC transporter ATP-binding protein [Jiangella alba]|uniref:Monosaccharide ABC transporter ATP-binding protein, CUT2 family n=1 Tax=Jiangella alba TaxID=561176 RepID=A0A1H5J9L5_9ACTN|nr:sugar ABC transporter ATP-binding protein [Jiangella alba]SEE49206.1 monosaccharide ABC transporter ATP-binding protein, CUT2 family [Jiangella alba]